MIPGVAAARAASLINRRGKAFTIGADPTARKAIVEERLSEVERNTPVSMLDGLRGRPAIFYVTPTVADLISHGDILLYRGGRWRVHPMRTVGAGDTDILVGILATDGAT